ncbi:hypothetical protein MGYG_01388 [Nannizzia gypsea CBS 118893]|uniref:Uncharacterized protein n=1 Tax=Arthroderma gypseum (strain ATCC MYA-4604 / CBS 118893) TaxID=535722 RepID=E5R0L2_ARTGP|nr:hypothetical protein MGYG_01388 [Nannizzia gypsea CBS 118893]EFQ98356.1 hypothetical protein MGYG_01388 [Nannizzia gypsea CBS 118893]
MPSESKFSREISKSSKSGFWSALNFHIPRFHCEHTVISKTVLTGPSPSPARSVAVFDVTYTNKGGTRLMRFLNILSGAQVLVTVTVAVAARSRILLA